MIIIVMGVAGSGKTTVGEILAVRLGWQFHDADDLHPPANREKMALGVALTDDDRRSWLDAVRQLIQRCLDRSASAIVACSALRESYRAELIVDRAVVKLVYLKGSYELITTRLAARQGHFFNRHLLRSQFDALEEPTDALVVDISRDPDAIADDIAARVVR
jgi:gluconokinase